MAGWTSEDRHFIHWDGQIKQSDTEHTDGDDLITKKWFDENNTTYTGGTNLTLVGTTFNVDDAFIKNDADDATTGKITAEGFIGWGICPIGSIMAWHKDHADTPALPDGWVECNGQTLNDVDSVYHNEVIPDINGAISGTARFVRGEGSNTTGDLKGATKHNHTITVNAEDAHTHNFTTGIPDTTTPVLPDGTNVASATHQHTGTTDTTSHTHTASSAEKAHTPNCIVMTWIMRVK